MKYVGLHTQISRNNRYSILLLLAFPCIILCMVWVFLAILSYLSTGTYDEYGNAVNTFDAPTVNTTFMDIMPWIVAGVALWFVIAYYANASMIQHAVGSRPLTRKENPRVYNIVENLCITCGMPMPKVNIVDDPQLNAFASGINKDSYAVTLTTGIIDLLDDEELAGVVGHELTHIRNHDTRLLITSIIFVGIVSTVMSIVVRMLYNLFLYGGSSRRSNDKESSSGIGILAVLAIGAICCAIAYFFTLVTRFAISRTREYMADAGGAELCRNPRALASALRKISRDPGLDNVKRQDVAQLFIMRPDEMESGLVGFIDSLFSTHPDPAKRIAILEQF